MDFFLDNNNYMTALKISAKIFAVWPTTPNSGSCEYAIFCITWWSYVINALYMLLGMIVGIYCCYADDIVRIMESFVEIIYILEALFNLVYCRAKTLQIQKLLGDMEGFDETSSAQAKGLKRNCLKRIRVVHATFPMTYSCGAVIFIFSPLLIPYKFLPLNTIYIAMPMETMWGFALAYGLNVIIIIQAFAAIVVDLIAIAIMWHATFKFTLVGVRIQILTEEQLRETVIMHQEAISYAKEVNHIISPIVVKSTAAVSLYIISCSLLILNNIPFLQLTQFFLVTFLSGLRLYVCSWSAEVMTTAAYNVCWKVYTASWFKASPKIQKTVLIIMERCQKPIIIYASGIIPVLSLSFCRWVFYKTLSYFLTLRAILHI